MLKAYLNVILSLALVLTFARAMAEGDVFPAGTLKQGTLANQQLIHDAMLGVASRVAVLGCDKPENFVPYIVAMPAGENGARRWTEKWLVTGCGKHYPVDIEFGEDGSNAANWTIHL